jgi:hypothetical protein
MSVEQQTAYNHYQNGNTVTEKETLDDLSVIDQSFVDYISNWKQVDPNSIHVPVENQNYTWEQFFKTCCSGSFHLHWDDNLKPAAFGPGVLIVDLRVREDGFYVLTYTAFESTNEFVLNPKSLHGLTSRSLVLEDAGIKLLFKSLSTKVGTVSIWNHQLELNGNLQSNFYLVPITF